MIYIANYFVPVNPYTTTLVTLAVGQRIDVIVRGRNDCKEADYMSMTEGPLVLDRQVRRVVSRSVHC